MITVVSGLPRSGTSLMMQILEVNGFDILTDNVKTADESNPKGYYEYGKVKKIIKDNNWISEAEGKTIKVIVQLLFYLPLNFNYKIILMERNIDEILDSQAKMLQMLGNKKQIPSDILRKTFQQQMDKSINWMQLQPNIESVRISFGNLFRSPDEELKKLIHLFDGKIEYDISRNVINPALYREKTLGNIPLYTEKKHLEIVENSLCRKLLLIEITFCGYGMCFTVQN